MIYPQDRTGAKIPKGWQFATTSRNSERLACYVSCLSGRRTAACGWATVTGAVRCHPRRRRAPAYEQAL